MDLQINWNLCALYDRVVSWFIIDVPLFYESKWWNDERIKSSNHSKVHRKCSRRLKIGQCTIDKRVNIGALSLFGPKFFYMPC